MNNKTFSYSEYFKEIGGTIHNEVVEYFIRTQSNCNISAPFVSAEMVNDALLSVNPTLVVEQWPKPSVCIERSEEGNAVRKLISEAYRSNPDYKTSEKAYWRSWNKHHNKLKAEHAAALAVLQAKEVGKAVNRAQIYSTPTRYKTNYGRVRITYLATLPISLN